MSRKDHFAALQEIRNWNLEAVVKVLNKNGLGGCVDAFKKRDIDGQALLDLTEVKLALWKRELNLNNIRKLSYFVEDLKKEPTKYQLIDNTVSEPLVKKELTNPTSLKDLLPIARSHSSSSYSDTGSWDTDFEDDLEGGHAEKMGNGVKSGNGGSTVSRDVAGCTNVTRSGSEVTAGGKPNCKPITTKVNNTAAPLGTTTRAPMKLNIPNAFTSKPDILSSKPKVLPKFPLRSKDIGLTIEKTNTHLPASSESEVQTVTNKGNSQQEGNKSGSVSNVQPRIRPVLPARPPNLTPKPEVSCQDLNLPKPPAIMQGNESVKDLISNLKLQCDDEYYESYAGEVDNNRSQQLQPSAEPNSVKHFPPVPKPSPTPPRLASKAPFSPCILKHSEHRESYQDEEYEVCDETNSFSQSGYESEEYESIQDHVAVVPISGDGTEDYLQPVTQPPQPLPLPPPQIMPTHPAPPVIMGSKPLDEAPPLPAKPRPLLPDVVVPTTRPPSPPRSRSEDSGSSGDGVTGKLGGTFWNRVFRPANVNAIERVKESTRTPDYKSPPPVDQRPVAASSTQGRPLPQPPTAEGSQQTSEKNTSNGRRKSGVKLPLVQMPWYHNVDRRRGEDMLKNGEDGCFLIRPSTQTQNPLTLTLWYNRRLYNISVRHRADGRYALGTEKINEQSFSSIEELVSNYQSEKLVLYSGGERTGTTLLTTSPRKDVPH